MMILQMWRQHLYYLNNREIVYLEELRDAMIEKITSGEWEYPFIQYTNGKETFLEKVDNIFTMKILDEYTKNIDELEEKMYKCFELGKAYDFMIVVDENNGF